MLLAYPCTKPQINSLYLGHPHKRRHILSSQRGLFEGLRTDAAEMTVAPGPVVEHFNVIEDIRPGCKRTHFGSPQFLRLPGF